MQYSTTFCFSFARTCCASASAFAFPPIPPPSLAAVALLLCQSLRLRSRLLRFCISANPSAFTRSCCASAFPPIPAPSLAVFRSKPIRSFFAGKLSLSTRDWNGALDSVFGGNCSKQLVCSTTLFQIWRVREMSRPQGEDDGSVLEYVTEDELQRGWQIAHYTMFETKIGECARCEVME